jgi:CheY-like chemotaxis protein
MPERNLPDPERAKPCVLVIDDDDAVVHAISARLGSDFHVVGLTDPSRAISRAIEEQPGVILCDIDMPGMSGDDVAFALSQNAYTAHIPLIYLTGLVTPEDSADLEGVFGEHPTLSKGATTEDLLRLINDALGIDEGGEAGSGQAGSGDEPTEPQPLKPL